MPCRITDDGVEVSVEDFLDEVDECFLREEAAHNLSDLHESRDPQSLTGFSAEEMVAAFMGRG
jgi:hypothetical protein